VRRNCSVEIWPERGFAPENYSKHSGTLRQKITAKVHRQKITKATHSQTENYM
jgi:hypothetical protein